MTGVLTETLLIGIDCATDDAKVGLARGTLNESGLCVDEALACGRERSAVERVADWLTATPGAALIAIDAPLGWPQPLGRVLSTHEAGRVITEEPNQLFRRETDRFIQRSLGKTPLDVGADRIARTAHAALRILGALRESLGVAIPLAWDPGALEGISAIEVYPAATLISRRYRSGGYKKPGDTAERMEMIESLSGELRLPPNRAAVETNADALDACICLLAASDFIRGVAAPPSDEARAVVEGWIWARAPYP
jgi:predicted RNase H-like nuclease